MLSRKPRRRRRVRRRPAESSLSQIAEAARAIIALAVGCRTAARGLLNARLQSSASLRNGDGGKRNSPPDGSNSPRSETGRIASGGHGAAKNAAESPSRPEMASQRIEKIESAPGNGMVSGASKPQDLVYGRAADCPLRRTKGGGSGIAGKLFLPASPWKQTKPNWNPSCSSLFGGRRCNGGDRLAESKASRPISASLAGNRRGGGCRPRKFSYPQPHEKARNGKGSCDRRSSRRPEPAFGGERCRRLSNCRRCRAAVSPG
jgi:hypothetical protein